MSRDRGSALLAVLWVVLIISMIAFTLAASVRAEVGAQTDSFDSEAAFFMAKSTAESMFSLFSKDPSFLSDGPFHKDLQGDYLFQFETGDVRVHFESAAGRIDLNEASDTLLAAMFDSVGVSQENRNHLVDSILDWRDDDDIPHLYGAEIKDYTQIPGQRLPRNAPFQSVDELLQVKNMTPEIFNGSVLFEPVSRQYQRLPGIRELVTVDSHSDKVELNETSMNVLQALPQMTGDLAARVIMERQKKLFGSLDDLVGRVPEMNNNPALQYLSVSDPVPTALVASARLRSSGVSRTVRIVFKRDERRQILSVQPFLYRMVNDIKFSHWQF